MSLTLDRARLKDCTKCWLIRTIDDTGPVLEIAPTAKNITHNGEKYFRMSSIAQLPDGSFAGTYLVESFGTRVLAAKARRKSEGASR